MVKSLLLVDDEVILAETMKELLQNAWLHVYTASNGAQALQIMRSHQIDCVVSDINMPVMDGLTFMQKSRELGSKVPFIFYSGYVCEKFQKIAEELGANSFLSKPDFKQLMQTIDSILGTRPIG